MQKSRKHPTYRDVTLRKSVLPISRTWSRQATRANTQDGRRKASVRARRQSDARARQPGLASLRLSVASCRMRIQDGSATRCSVRAAEGALRRGAGFEQASRRSDATSAAAGSQNLKPSSTRRSWRRMKHPDSIRSSPSGSRYAVKFVRLTKRQQRGPVISRTLHGRLTKLGRCDCRRWALSRPAAARPARRAIARRPEAARV